MLEIQRFDPSQCDFPRPGVPTLPVLQLSLLGLSAGATTRCAIDPAAGARFFSRGRYALHSAYRIAGVGPEGALLAPTYHCRTMIDPAMALDGAVLLYRVNADLTPDLDSVSALVAHSLVPVKALLIPHYFGWEQPAALMDELQDFCRERGIVVIEDCSHAWQVAARRALAGKVDSGHMLIASPYKFFSSTDGGMLWSNPAQPRGPCAGLEAELKALRAMWSGARHGVHNPARAAVRLDPAAISRGADVAERSNQPSSMYQRAEQGRSGLALSRWVMRRTRVDLVVERRRAHYRRWLAAVAGLSGGRALFPDMPADCAPYMIPLYVERPDPDFFVLKKMGMPIYRWDEMAVSDCPVATRYRLHVFHLPCHQSLSEQQMHWMTTMLAEVLR